MRYNVEKMELRRGTQTLTIAQEFIEGSAAHRRPSRDEIKQMATDLAGATKKENQRKPMLR